MDQSLEYNDEEEYGNEVMPTAPLASNTRNNDGGDNGSARRLRSGG